MFFMVFIVLLAFVDCAAAESCGSPLVGQNRSACLRPEVLFSSLVSTESRNNISRDHGPFAYELCFGLEVEGKVTLLSRTRYYKSEDLHLKLMSQYEPMGWRFRTVGLKTNEGLLNFAIGEGPRRHQRYVLVPARPSAEEKGRIEEKILGLEGGRGCQVGYEALENTGAGKGDRKKAYFNYYLWEGQNRGSLGFLVTPEGDIACVSNQVDVAVLSKPGGKRANPRFFESLQFALAGTPPFSGEQACAQTRDGVVYWEMPGAPISVGLVELSRQVYGRKMTLLDPEGLGEQRIEYEARLVEGTSVIRIRGYMPTAQPTPVRVSGFKASLWIESLEREVYLDILEGRILKDEIEVSFGIERKKKVFPVSGTKNTVRLQLVDECFAGYQNTDKAILMAYGKCSPQPNPRPLSDEYSSSIGRPIH